MPGFASPSFGGLAFIGSLAIVAQFSFRSMTLRHRVSPVLLFIEANLLSRIKLFDSIQQVF
jgi:hypothetical protein